MKSLHLLLDYGFIIIIITFISIKFHRKSRLKPHNNGIAPSALLASIPDQPNPIFHRENERLIVRFGN